MIPVGSTADLELLLSGEVQVLRRFLAGLLAAPWAPHHLPMALHAMAMRAWAGYHLPIRPADVLAASGLGRSRANTLFRSFFGETPGEHLARVRILMAQRDLRRGMGVAEAATKWGFASPQVFSRTFRAQVGLSPAAWKRQQSQPTD